jgi:hypothetical protein
MREAAGVRESAKIFGIAEHRLRVFIKQGLVTPRAVGRRSIVLFDELREAIRSQAPTRSSRRHINEQREAEHGTSP